MPGANTMVLGAKYGLSGAGGKTCRLTEGTSPRLGRLFLCKAHGRRAPLVFVINGITGSAPAGPARCLPSFGGRKFDA